VSRWLSLRPDHLAAGRRQRGTLDAEVLVEGRNALKAGPGRAEGRSWIDRVVVAGKTFQYGANGPEGLLPKGKKVFVASSRGGIYTGNSPAAALEHHETYLKGVLSFIGLTDITIIRAEGLSLGQEGKDASVAKAKAEIAAIAA
jgi:FMN-dependent NADH-azoreductase